MDPDRFQRMEMLVGPAGLERLRQTSVAVFGVGGVGSFATEALARAGIGQLTLIDFDTVCTSNINRQLHALEQTVGRPKVQVMAERCRAINPQLQVEPLQEFYNAETSAELLGRPYDYVLDCIDLVTAKIHLIWSCKERGIPLMSSMGAANKLDPTLIRIGDLFVTRNCGLARVMRKELRRRGVSEGVKVVYSTEEARTQPGSKATPATPRQSGQGKLPLGSSSYIPPIFGLTMAGEVIRTLIGDSLNEH